MSAETLRRAAALMRERANAATPGPWEARPPHGWDEWEDHLVYAGAMEVTPGGGMHGDGGPNQADAAHIASWQPAVALAVADLLENEANAWQAAADDQEMRALYPPYNGARAALLTEIAQLYLNENESFRPEGGGDQ